MTRLLAPLAFVACFAGCQPSALEGPERIVLIVVDTLRADHVGIYGGSARTPNMDRLATEGQYFANALASYHQTSMSMGAMFTGQIPSLERTRDGQPLPWTSDHYCGMARFQTTADAACVPEALDTLAESLHADGYWTLGVVANPLLFDPYGYSQGFDRWIEVGPMPGGYYRTGSKRQHADLRTGRYVNDAVLDALRARPSDRFVLYAHYLDVHDWLLRKHSYQQGIEVFDGYLGELVAFLESEDLIEGTTIILTSDHGEAFGEPHPIPSPRGHAGNPSFEPVLRVPLIVWPARFADDAAVVRGQDLPEMTLSLLAREGGRPNAVDAHEQYVSERRYQLYRGGRWKSLWPRDGSPPLLFDLETDPDETESLANARPDILAAHRERIDQLVGELATDDPQPRSVLTEDERARLHVLGYLDEEEAATERERAD